MLPRLRGGEANTHTGMTGVIPQDLRGVGEAGGSLGMLSDILPGGGYQAGKNYQGALDNNNATSVPLHLTDRDIYYLPGS